MKNETIEEAAKNYGWRIKINTFSDAVKANELAESAQQDFIKGAEWQAKSMYSIPLNQNKMEEILKEFGEIGFPSMYEITKLVYELKQIELTKK